MKRLFNKSKRNDAQSATSTPPNGGNTPPGTAGNRPVPQQAQYHPPRPGQPYGPPGQQYVLVPVPVQDLQSGGDFAQAQGGGMPRPPRVQDVGNAIGWSVAMPSFDWTYLLALGDHLSANSSASKEATKALIKEFKHATPHAQERAVRLTGLLWINTNERFKEQVASKKFLAALTDTVADPSTAPPVKATVYRVLSPLAFDAQSTPALRPIAETFNRLLTDPKTSLSSFPNELDPTLAAFQPNGAPLAPDDPLLRPESLLSHGRGSGRSRPMMERFPTGIEQMRDLRRRAVEGKGWAGMLAEAVALAGDEPTARNKGHGKRWEEMNTEEKEAAQARGEGPDGIEVAHGEEVEVREGLEANEVVQEFHSRCLEAQDFLTTNLEWASVQAEQSRTKADVEAASAPTPAPASGAEAGEASHLASNNPFAAVVAGGEAPGRKSGATEEEEILSLLLEAMTEISDALHLYALRLSHSRQSAQEDAELAAALDRSRADDRFDRFAHGEAAAVAHGAGGSGTASRDPFVDESVRHVEGKGKDRESLNPYASYTEPASSQAGASPYDGLEALEGLGGLSLSSPSAAGHPQSQPNGLTQQFSPSNPYAAFSSRGSNGGYAVPDAAPLSTEDHRSDELTAPQGTTESSFLREYVPVQPSAKALGKLRRVSVGMADDQSPEERQHQLEDALREKYERNYREEQERRGRDGA